ncbi:hypothetical protein [Thiothrix subterranea]|uniref:hypothetical protein n=1 Tax=Thiothrix subterranea TaxID=2735563 RepID=UPI00280A51F8|nr:hypothetical protein [Thiothrix subterranea]
MMTNPFTTQRHPRLKTLLGLLLVASSLLLGAAQAEDKLKVGFIYVSPIGDAGGHTSMTPGAKHWRKSSATKSKLRSWIASPKVLKRNVLPVNSRVAVTS